MTSTIAAVVMILAGLGAVLLAFEVLGNPKIGTGRKGLLLAHRIFGYTFAFFFLALFALMAGRFKSGAFSPLGLIHASIAAAAFVALLVKLLIVKRYKKFSDRLFYVGGFLFLTSFVTVFIAAGPNIGAGFAPVKQVETQAVSSQLMPEKMWPVEKLIVAKCGKCHELGRAIYGIHETKTEQAWLNLISKMQKKDPTITQADAEQIAQYMVQLAAN
jgi:hypothetical protein